MCIVPTSVKGCQSNQIFGAFQETKKVKNQPLFSVSLISYKKIQRKVLLPTLNGSNDSCSFKESILGVILDTRPIEKLNVTSLIKKRGTQRTHQLSYLLPSSHHLFYLLTFHQLLTNCFLGNLNCIAGATSRNGAFVWDVKKGKMVQRFHEVRCIYCQLSNLMSYTVSYFLHAILSEQLIIWWHLCSQLEENPRGHSHAEMNSEKCR